MNQSTVTLAIQLFFLQTCTKLPFRVTFIQGVTNQSKSIIENVANKSIILDICQ